MIELTSIILGALGALLAIFLKEAVQQAHVRRTRAWQLFGYLFALKKSIVRNTHLFKVYIQLEERHNKLLFALEEGTESFKNSWEAASKARNDFREKLKATILAELSKKESIELNVSELAMIGFASESVNLRRDLLINSKSFMSDESSSILGSSVAMNVIQFRAAMIDVLSAIEGLLKVIQLDPKDSKSTIAELVDQIIVSGDDALESFIKLDRTVDAISKQTITQHVLAILRSR